MDGALFQFDVLRLLPAGGCDSLLSKLGFGGWQLGQHRDPACARRGLRVPGATSGGLQLCPRAASDCGHEAGPNLDSISEDRGLVSAIATGARVFNGLARPIEPLSGELGQQWL